jgi:photosystem II stability/assembly factor-like uncharacterized protein
MNRSLFKLTLFIISSLFFLSILAFPGPPVWQNLGPWRGVNIDILAIDPQRPSTLYAGVGYQIFKSTDSGSNWHPVGDGWPRGIFPSALAVSPLNSTLIYAMSSTHVYKTNNGGLTWVKTPADVPGNVSSGVFAVDPQNENTLYAGTDSGLFKSTDGGSRWDKLADNCQKLALDPQNSKILFCSGIKHFDRSEDGGLTWTSLNFADLDEYGNYCIEAIAVDPTSSDRIYVLSPKGIFESQNGGVDWSLRSSLKGYSSWMFQGTLIIDPRNPAILYIQIYQGDPTSSRSAQSMKSLDGGRTWTTLWDITLFSDSFPPNPCLLLDPQRSLTIYELYPGPDGIRRSYDGGGTWQVIRSGLPRTGMGIVDLDFASADSSPAIYAVNRGSGGVLKSENGGAAWIPKNDGLKIHTGNIYDGSTTVRRLTTDRRNPETVYCILESFFYYKGPFNYSLHKSTDGGGVWILLHQWPDQVYVRRIDMDPANSSKLYAATSQGIQKSQDGGISWQEMNVGLADHEVADLVIHPHVPGLLLAATAGGVFKSMDGGASWFAANSGLENQSVSVLLLTSDSPTTLYAGTNVGIFKSIDEGVAWRPVMAGLDSRNITALATDPGNSSILYAGTNGGGVYKSQDGGANWAAFNEGLNDLNINCLGVDPADSNRIYIGTQTGVYSTFNPPRISLSPNHLNFGQVLGQAAPPSQAFQIRNSGQGMITWTAIGTPGWIRVASVSGSGNGLIAVGVNTTGLQPGFYSGVITISDPGAADSPQSVFVNLEIYLQGTTEPPFGCFDTPLDGLIGISGSIPVTGWALDDVEVTGVKIYRNLAEGEPAQPSGLVYVGDSVFVDGARPDVETAYPGYPLNYRAGWGYLLLTNSLPDGGNGTYTLYAIATDKEGNQVSLGQKTITCDNRNAVKPFGAIDTPTQGGTASGNAFINFGWALTPQPKLISMDGSTILVWVDGLPLGHPTYNNYRADIASLFPGFANSNGAVGFYYLDTTGYFNGVHTIAWSVEDSQGAADGIGSRYFQILNSGSGSSVGGTRATISGTANLPSTSGVRSIAEIQNHFSDMTSPIHVRRGYGFDRPAESVFPNREGMIGVSISELERVAIYLDPAQAWETREELEARGRELRETKNSFYSSSVPDATPRYSSFLLVGSELRPLPIGSTFDAERGVLYWQPGPGFLGDFDFIFVENGRNTKKAVKIRIGT